MNDAAAQTPAPDSVRSLRQARWTGLKTIIIREYGRIIRIWAQTIVPSAVTSALYFVIFGSLIGQRVGLMDGVPYMQYIAPGLIMMAVITNSFANVVSSFFSSKLMLHLEEMLVAPLAHTTIVLGFVVGGVVRGLLVAALVVVVALFFTDLHIAHPLITFTTILLTAVVFSTAGLFNAIFAKTFDDISIIPTFVLTPLTYLGGVFFSISLLPPFWQHVAQLNPILYMVNAFRYGMLGSADISIGMAYAIMGGAAAALFAAVLFMLKRGTG
ncbi:MAG TPA: ABC transporter permease, partial [Steroidobacteraceae bacterium]|nr:ABC transporter permease [Steroidobacteraceae bacterium]